MKLILLLLLLIISGCATPTRQCACEDQTASKMRMMNVRSSLEQECKERK